MADSEKCIYCGAGLDPAQGEGDHIIPVQLGEFREDVRFRRICVSCNNAIGKSEQQFLRCGPESFLRDVVKPKVPTRRQRGRSPAKRVMGTPGPESTVDRGDHNELVFRCQDNPLNVLPVDQLVVHDDNGQERFIRLFPGIRPKQLLERVKKAGIGTIQRVWLHCEEDHYLQFRDLIHAAWPDCLFHELPSTETGIHPIKGQITLKVTDHYFRAIAKIGFHYYLAHSQRGVKGDEECFEPIRSFIMTGGNSDKFFCQSRATFAVPYGKRRSGGVVTPSRWCHVMSADESTNTISVYVQFFVGPGCVPRPYYITLGTIDSSLLVPGLVWGHVYLYDESPLEDGYAGRLEQAQVRQLR